jgi:flagellin-like hook-associated protein FlgL
VNAADLNNDGILDLVSSNPSAGLSVFLGYGDGSFSNATNYVVGSSPRHSSTGDFNGDGILDLVSANSTGGNISLLLGNGDGTFGSAANFSTGTTTNSIYSADFNGDGNLDVAVGTQSKGTGASVMLGDGRGSFGTPRVLDTGIQSYTLAIGDYNGDGVLDISSMDTNSSTISVLIAQTVNGVSPIESFSLGSSGDALQAKSIFQRRRQLLAIQRGQIGAYQNRLSSATATLHTQSVKFLEAESRIRNTDIAADSARLVRSQILQQASSAVLAQANQQPALALQLLSS